MQKISQFWFLTSPPNPCVERFWYRAESSKASVGGGIDLAIGIGYQIFQDLPDVYYAIAFSASFERVDFHFLKTYPVVVLIVRTNFPQKRPLNRFKV